MALGRATPSSSRRSCDKALFARAVTEQPRSVSRLWTARHDRADGCDRPRRRGLQGGVRLDPRPLDPPVPRPPLMAGGELDPLQRARADLLDRFVGQAFRRSPTPHRIVRSPRSRRRGRCRFASPSLPSTSLPTRIRSGLPEFLGTTLYRAVRSRTRSIGSRKRFSSGRRGYP